MLETISAHFSLASHCLFIFKGPSHGPCHLHLHPKPANSTVCIFASAVENGSRAEERTIPGWQEDPLEGARPHTPALLPGESRAEAPGGPQSVGSQSGTELSDRAHATRHEQASFDPARSSLLRASLPSAVTSVKVGAPSLLCRACLSFISLLLHLPVLAASPLSQFAVPAYLRNCSSAHYR